MIPIIGVLMDWIISDFIRDPIQKIVKIIRSLSVSEFFSWIKIRFDYLSVFDRLAIIHQYPTLSEDIRSNFIQMSIQNIFIIYFLIRFLVYIIIIIYFISNLC
jgi:hypothetical protein